MTGKDGVALAIVDRCGGWRRFWGPESRADARELGDAAGVRQEAEVADAAKALGQDVEQKATDELLGVERHRFGFVVGAVVLPPETDRTILRGEDPAVGDRNGPDKNLPRT